MVYLLFFVAFWLMALAAGTALLLPTLNHEERDRQGKPERAHVLASGKVMLTQSPPNSLR